MAGVCSQTRQQSEEFFCLARVMTGQQTLGPDPSRHVPSATAILREQPEDVTFESDFTELVARFAAKSGGGLSAELSADLALEIVLNEIVEQACRITGASGAAIVLEREGEMVCRASSGPTAPQLGSRIDTQSGLSGECLRTRRNQCCDDARDDPRADLEASERVGVRSAMMMPLLCGDELLGLFQLFSTQSFAFGVRDERALEALGDRTVSNLDQASGPAEPEAYQDAAQLVDSPEREKPRAAPEAPDAARATAANRPVRAAAREIDVVVWLLGVAVLAAAVLLGVALGRRLKFDRASSNKVPAPTPSALITNGARTSGQIVQTNGPEKQATGGAKAPVRASVRGAVPAGGLMVFENGKQVFRRPQNLQIGEDGVQRASDVEAESVQDREATAERETTRRVEPQYPEAARAQGIQGAVVLEVHIGAGGAVEEVEVISGSPLLAQASADAVRQWKFQPRMAKGHPAEMQIRITLNFRLPQ
jgi:TonB family protein